MTYFFWRWAQVLSHHFFNDWLEDFDQRRGSATGNTIGSTTGKQNGKQQRKMKSEKNIWYFNLFNCLKYFLYINRRKNGKSTDFCEIFFLKMGTSPKSSFFQRLARGLRPNDGVSATGTTSRCVSLLWVPLHYPVFGSKSSSQSLKKWWLWTCAHLQKIFHKNLWFSIFSFDLYTESILKQLNKLKNIIIFVSLFIFLCCFPFCFPVVLPYCIPRCTTPSLGRSPRACLSPTRARGWPEDFDPVPRDPVPALSRKPQRGVNGEMMQNEKCQKNENDRFLKTRKNCFCNIVKC